MTDVLYVMSWAARLLDTDLGNLSGGEEIFLSLSQTPRPGVWK